MHKAVEIVKKEAGFVLLPKEGFLMDGKPCALIDQTHGWWIHMRDIEGGASDGIGNEVIVRDFVPEDFDIIQQAGGQCYVEVDHGNELICPKNGRGDRKIVIFTSKLEEDAKG